ASLAAGLRWCNRRRCRAERDLLATAAVISRGRPMALPSTPIARPTLKAPLAVGDIAPEVVLRAVDGATIELNGDTMAGNVIIVLFCPRFSAGVGEAVAALRASAEAFVAAGAKLVAITLSPAKVAAEQALPFPLLLDRSGDVFRAYNADQREAPTTVVLRANQHVAAILKDAPGAQVSAALGVVERLAAERQSGLMAPHPPVLIVPDVLSRDDRRRLIRIYETRGKTFVEPRHGDDKMTTDYKMRIPEYGRNDRIDHWLVEADTNTFIDGRLQTRLFPEIRRAFQYRITRR